MLGISIFENENITHDLIEFAINFILIFMGNLVPALLLLGGFPTIEQLYLAALQSLVPAILFLVAKRGLLPYLKPAPQLPEPEEEE